MITNNINLFIQVLIYTSGIMLPITIISLLVYLSVKYGINLVIKTINNIAYKTINHLKNIFDFFVNKYRKIFFEITTVIQVIILNQHQPQTDVQYIAFVIGCVSIIYLLVKRGKVKIEDIKKITDCFVKNENQKPE